MLEELRYEHVWNGGQISDEMIHLEHRGRDFCTKEHSGSKGMSSLVSCIVCANIIL